MQPPKRSLKATLACLNPTIGSLAGDNLGSQPGAGAPSGPPKGEAQGIAEKLAAFSGARGRPISRVNANALAAKGNAGKGYCTGGVMGVGGNPHPRTAGRGLVAKPWSSSRVGRGGGVALGQRINRR